MSEKSLTHGIKFKDKIGYAMGDMGGLLTFSLIGAFQNKFYTDVLHIQPAKIVVLILVARLWDAINDPIWGAFIDSRKPTKQGKFRPYVFWFSIPLAVSAAVLIGCFGVVVLSLLLSTFVLVLAAVLSAVIGLAAGVWLIFTSPANGLATFGLSLLVFGLGLLAGIFSIWLCKVCLSGISKGVGRMIKKRGGKKYEI